MVSGLSPQVITETLFAPAVGLKPEFIPTQVHVVTTGRGRRDGVRMLLERGWLARLGEDYPPLPTHPVHYR